ncbi:MAG: hypothetical protein K1X72_23030 [Pyrinomonadaceae bacterium]|nr:hypothetical protein [Pyrinomonadaceae bacterium]
MKKLIIAGSLVIGLFTVSSFAQQTENPNPNQNQNQAQNRKQKRGGNRGQNVKNKVMKMDLNGDGYISKEEWTRNEKAFDRIDTNKDGRLSKEEMQQFRQQRGGKGGKNKPNPNN